MAAGFEVSRNLLDARAGEAAKALRDALTKVNTLKQWLDAHPGYDAQSFLVTEFGYTQDEAYLLQNVFTELDTIRLSNAAALLDARRLTGLE